MPPRDFYNYPVPEIDNYDSMVTLVSLINSKVNEKISRAKIELNEGSASDKTELGTRIDANLTAINEILEQLNLLETKESHNEDKTTLETAITEGDATTLATARAYAKALHSKSVRAYTAEEIQEIELENGESVIYFDLSNLNLVKKSKSDQGEVTDQIIGKLTAGG